MAQQFLNWVFEGRSNKWLYAFGFVFLIVMMHYGGALFFLPITLMGDYTTWPPAVARLAAMLVLLPMLLIPFLWVWLVHKRPWWSIVGTKPRIEAWNFGMGILAALIVTIVTWLYYGLVLGVPISFGAPHWATYLPVFLVAIPKVFMQTTAEEIIFRGYGMQAVRSFTASPVAIVVVTALAFALPHYPNVLLNEWPWWGLIAFALPALLFGWMVFRTGSLWMPMGWHWFNNFALSEFIKVNAGTATGPAAGTAFMFSDGRPSLGQSLVTQAVSYVLIAVFITYLVGRREAARSGGDSQSAI
ncbi:CPBP family intramembrane glutamic endopeptidase [Defluviimonas sp. SAOS-178_SWC]|uniref:CPBP family intramembrane glutamic endopeptidase n=1 Tax=Defluviimonas sp. SAOS-178_SWC TaxID=3121287 RepID=UPI0032221792